MTKKACAEAQLGSFAANARENPDLAPIPGDPRFDEVATAS